MQIVLFEDKKWSDFLPLVYTRPVGDLRIGILRISEKYERAMMLPVTHETRAHLRALFPPVETEESVYVNARILPDNPFLDTLRGLDPGDELRKSGVVLARKVSKSVSIEPRIVEYDHELVLLEKITDLFSQNGEALKRDFALLTHGKKSAPLHASNVLIGDPDLVFLAEGAKVFASSINTLDGPVFIDRDAEVMEGSHIRGPFYLGEHAALKMGSKIYGPTTIGPHCKVGGEVSNSILHGYSNKAHDGFIGNSLIGEWCNLGADSNTSNLKNNYSPVRIWNYTKAAYTDTGLTFCGLIMGDHSKCGINTMFNTGTVVGACCNIYGGGFPDKHLPSFTWGGSDGMVEYELPKVLETAGRVMARRGIELTTEMRIMLTDVFRHTLAQRELPPQSQD